MQMIFYKTGFEGKKKNKHDHILYAIGSEVCLCSVDKEHAHIIMPQMAVGAVVSEETGEETSPATDFRWIIEPAGDDGHTHEGYELFVPELPKIKIDKDKEVINVYDLLKAEKEREEWSRLMGEEAIDYCDRNKQWLSSIKTKLNNAKRACLTLNSIKPIIDILEGYFRQNRKDIKVSPTEEGDQVVADVLNLTMKFITKECNYFEEENKIFHFSVVPGRGFFHSYINWNKNWEGDIVIEYYDWDGAYLGPHKKNDGSDCEHATKTSWMSMAELQNRYPDKADKIKQNYDALMDSLTYTNNDDSDRTVSSHNIFSGFDPKEIIDLYKKQFMLVEQYQREYYTSNVIIDVEANLSTNADNWPVRDINRLRTIPNLKILSRTPYRVKVVMAAGMVHLSSRYLGDDYRLFKDPDIPLFPTYYNRTFGGDDGDTFTGKVAMLIDPQNEKNKHRSLMADYATMYLNSLTYIDRDMFNNAQDLYDFEKKSNTPGAIVTLKNIERRPYREIGFKFPDGLFNMVQVCKDEIKQIANVPDAMGGGDEAREESGIAIFRRVKQALVGNEILFDNFSLTKIRAFNYILRLIPECWNTNRFMRLLSHLNTQKEGVTLGGRKMVNDDFAIPEGDNPEDYIYKAAIEEILYKADLSRYDVALSETQYTETVMLANLAIILQALQYGVDVGPDLLNLMPLPQKYKDSITKYMTQSAQSQQQLENKKIDSEVIKTQIAHQNELQ